MAEPMRRGDVVEVRVHGGGTSTRRVWATDGDGVQVCSENEWQRAISTGSEPLWVGWPLEEVLRVVQHTDNDTSIERINPFAGDLESLSSPRKGERCMICGAREPSSHATVRLEDNLHWGIICAKHTLRQVVLSGLIDLELRVGERFLDKPLLSSHP